MHIRYLIVIPTVLPKFAADLAPWEPPFLDLIIAQRNRLKTCLIPGKTHNVSVTLFLGYQPCSADICQVVACVELLRRLTKHNPPVALVRLYEQDRKDKRQSDDAELSAAFARQSKAIQVLSLKPLPLLDIRLFLNPRADLSDDFVARLLVDILSWESHALWIGCDAVMESAHHRRVIESLGLSFQVSVFDHAIAFGRAVSH
jgi:hypothetical protein